MKSRWQEYKEKNGVTPLDLLNPMTKPAPEEISSKRISICMDCDKIVKGVNQCIECGCFMNIKTKLENAKCPLGKW